MPEGRDLDLRSVQYRTIGTRSSLPHDDLGREERRGGECVLWCSVVCV